MAVIHYAGTVIRAYQVPDKRGVNPKDRPVLLVENFSDTDAEVYCVAITGAFDFPLPATSILLPFSSSRNRCKTGLDKESVADCTWTVVVAACDIIERMGHIKATHLIEVRANLQ